MIHSIHGLSGNRIAEYSYDAGTGTSTLIREYIWRDGRAIGVVEGGQVFFIRTDHTLPGRRFCVAKSAERVGRPVFATNDLGASVYGYALQNPGRWSDFRGMQSMTFNGSSLQTFDDSGQPLQSYPAVSGKPESCQCSEDMYLSDFGPIPEGLYTVNPADTNKWTFLKYLAGWGSRISWGNQRTLIVPDGHDAGGRFQMYIHGGSFPGSAGCVDLTRYNDAFHEWLAQQSGPVPLFVDYPDNNHPTVQ